MRPVVLTFVRFYLPGFKCGGPVRSIANLVEALSDEFEFRIVTSDRDMLDTTPYPSIQVDTWTRVGNAWVYYASEEKRGVLKWYQLMGEQPHDALYLNSLFDPTFTLKPLLARRIGRSGRKPVIVAPRGELFPGALALKWWKKFPFLAAARMLGLYRHALFHASTEEEAEQIRKKLGRDKEIAVATNLPAQNRPPPPTAPPANATGVLRVVFLSRISRKKNLTFALRVLSRCIIPIQFDIWGTIEEASYWRACEKLMQGLPRNVRASYRGIAHHENVLKILSAYDLFFLPTQGENYGHVIAESLSVGTPVLISDQTPWRKLSQHGVGWDLPLDRGENGFAEAIAAANERFSMESTDWRHRVYEFAEYRLSSPRTRAASREVFTMAVNRRNDKS